MEQIHFSLMKKIKIGHPEDSLTPHLPTSDNISFLPYALPPVRTFIPPQKGCHMGEEEGLVEHSVVKKAEKTKKCKFS